MSWGRSPNTKSLSWLKGSRFARNVGWNILSNTGGRLLGPVFQILIARIILPGDFGVFAIGVAWLAVFDIGKDWGLSQAIVVRRGGSAEIALQFTVQLITAFAFYALTLAATPVAAHLFGLPSLEVVLPLMGLIAFISAVADPIITDCLMAQHYRRLAIRQMVMPVVTGVVGLVLAYLEYGVYSLVIGLLVGHAAGAFSLVAGGRTGLRMSLDLGLVRDLMPVGKHIVFQRLFGYLVAHADSLIVGKALGPQALGLYRIGNLVAFLIPTAVVTQAQQVVFTELSARSGPENIRRHYNLFADIAGVMLMFYSVAVYLAAPLLVPAVLGEQWQPSVPFIQIFATVVVTGFTTPLNADLAKILGFIRIYTYLAAVRSVATVIALLWAAQYSTMHVVITWVAVGFVSGFMNEVVFYAKQDVVRLTFNKAALTVASWIWAAFAIVEVLRS
jgi:O-antigen/teichoic acid export membrane protein